jgi:hypothetical protein
VSEPERPDCCAACRFWLSLGADGLRAVGECRRHAPSPRIPASRENKGDSYAWWPLTDDTDFCGEWQPLPVVQRRDVPPPAGERGGDA